LRLGLSLERAVETDQLPSETGQDRAAAPTATPAGDRHRLAKAAITYYRNGPNDGKSQLALTAGLVVGRFELGHRARLIIGGGYQKVVSSFKTTEHTWLLTARVAF
jgi:hypothetical protein